MGHTISNVVWNIEATKWQCVASVDENLIDLAAYQMDYMNMDSDQKKEVQLALCFMIVEPMLLLHQSSMNISKNQKYHCLLFGGNTTQLSCQRALKPARSTFQTLNLC
jgi:hypothetical protein